MKSSIRKIRFVKKLLLGFVVLAGLMGQSDEPTQFSKLDPYVIGKLLATIRDKFPDTYSSEYMRSINAVRSLDLNLAMYGDETRIKVISQLTYFFELSQTNIDSIEKRINWVGDRYLESPHPEKLAAIASGLSQHMDLMQAFKIVRSIGSDIYTWDLRFAEAMELFDLPDYQGIERENIELFKNQKKALLEKLISNPSLLGLFVKERLDVLFLAYADKSFSIFQGEFTGLLKYKEMDIITVKDPLEKQRRRADSLFAFYFAQKLSHLLLFQGNVVREHRRVRETYIRESFFKEVVLSVFSEGGANSKEVERTLYSSLPSLVEAYLSPGVILGSFNSRLREKQINEFKNNIRNLIIHKSENKEFVARMISMSPADFVVFQMSFERFVEGLGHSIRDYDRMTFVYRSLILKHIQSFSEFKGLLKRSVEIKMLLENLQIRYARKQMYPLEKVLEAEIITLFVLRKTNMEGSSIGDFLDALSDLQMEMQSREKYVFEERARYLTLFREQFSMSAEDFSFVESGLQGKETPVSRDQNLNKRPLAEIDYSFGKRSKASSVSLCPQVFR